MNIKKLKRELGRDFVVQRSGKGETEVLTKAEGRPVRFAVDGSWKSAEDAANYIRSRMPVATIRR